MFSVTFLRLSFHFQLTPALYSSSWLIKFQSAVVEITFFYSVSFCSNTVQVNSCGQ